MFLLCPTGCEYHGKSYVSGSEWKDPGNPCRVFTCKAGVVTESEEVCYVPCPAHQSLPPAPGQCCRTCPSEYPARRAPAGPAGIVPQSRCSKGRQFKCPV